MESYAIIFIGLFTGFLLKKSKFLPVDFHLGLNTLIISFFIPILTILYVPELKLSINHFWLIITPWIIYLSSVVYFLIYNYFKPIPKQTLGALIMTSGIGSISFVGFPIFETFYGKEGLTYGIILSLGGTFIVCNSIGILTGYLFKEDKPSVKTIFKRIFKFPPFIAMIISIVLMLSGYHHTPIVEEILFKLSIPFSTLALITIGMQIDTKGFSKDKKFFISGQVYKLIIAPMLIFLLFYFLGQEKTVVAKICILGAGVGSMYTIAIVAAQLNLNPKLAMLMPSLGIPISIFTLFIIYYLIA
jgi:predicted permease